LQSSIPYTERHFQRIDRLVQRSFILDYTLQSMQLQADDTKQSLAEPAPVSEPVEAVSEPAVAASPEPSAKKRKREQRSAQPAKKQKTITQH
jgi:uncharacterized membrane protein